MEKTRGRAWRRHQREIVISKRMEILRNWYNYMDKDEFQKWIEKFHIDSRKAKSNLTCNSFICRNDRLFTERHKNQKSPCFLRNTQNLPTEVDEVFEEVGVEIDFSYCYNRKNII